MSAPQSITSLGLVIFYSTQAILALAALSIPMLMSVYLFFIREQRRSAVGLLLFGALLVRLLMAAIDPFLHDWDERFHALVAKNMMDQPLKPMLRLIPLLPFNLEDWCCNHVWLHKQPLFLWQMALSMKILGAGEMSMRIPSVLMGVITVWMVYDIARYWIGDTRVAYLAASCCAFSYYQLELTSGRLMLDQNDMAFGFYVTASIWAFIRYINSGGKWTWALLAGAFVAAAVLCKWLTGILVFGGWGLFLLLHSQWRGDWRHWTHLLLAALFSVVLFLPWQLYIQQAFPLESSIIYQHNTRHIFEVVEGHHGSIWFHLAQWPIMYGWLSMLLFFPGLYALYKTRPGSAALSISLMVMVLVITGFFSLLVKTKMPSFTYPVHALMWIIAGLGAHQVLHFLVERFSINARYAYAVMSVLLAIAALQPWEIAGYRSENNEYRARKIHNTYLYKNILDIVPDATDLQGRVVLNLKDFGDTELMFYQGINAYNWYPEEHRLDSLKSMGHRFAAFESHNKQQLPDYILSDTSILIIARSLR